MRNQSEAEVKSKLFVRGDVLCHVMFGCWGELYIVLRVVFDPEGVLFNAVVRTSCVPTSDLQFGFGMPILV